MLSQHLGEENTGHLFLALKPWGGGGGTTMMRLGKESHVIHEIRQRIGIDHRNIYEFQKISE